MITSNRSIFVCMLLSSVFQGHMWAKAEKHHKKIIAPEDKHTNNLEHEHDVSFTEVDDHSDHQKNHQRLYFLYLKASYLHTRGRIQEAVNAFQSLLEHNPPSYVYDGYLALLFDIGQFQKIVDLVEKQEKLFKRVLKGSLDLQLIVAQSYIHLNQDAKAATILVKLAKDHPENAQIAYYAAIALLKSGQLIQAHQFIDGCLNNADLQSKHFLFYFLKSKICMSQNNMPQALAYIEQSLEKFPKFDRGWLLLGMLKEQQGKITEAIKGYKNFLDLVGRDMMVEKQLIQLLFSQKRFSEAASYLEKIKSETPEYFFDLALIQHKGGDCSAALANVNQALKCKPDFQQARLLKIDILMSEKKFDKILKSMRAWIERNPLDEVALHTLLILRKGPLGTQKIIALLEELIKDKKHSSMVIIALADLYTEIENYPRALYCYEQLLTMTNNEQMKAGILYQLGYLYHCSGQADKAENSLKQSIQRDATNSSAYNLLAYHYVTAEKNLPQALELIDKALLQNPQSSYYLDTKGCILLKLGRKQEALTILQQASTQDPRDATIQKHLATAQSEYKN